ncbi:hypothetical protein [Hugenholtzia roseola]|uniref:hypothetical protein n=1 Tax=Hugenholtzia roseola TaxID=1002 RepID=UPI0004797A73|nr:hypothetical protein [Hugenholtzia roseola]
MKNTNNLKTVLFVLFFLLLPLSLLAEDLHDKKRVGCICRDGVKRNTTGAGSCAGHKGVKYWLYADVSVYEAYGDNLPAIPPSELIEITPEEAEKIAKEVVNGIADEVEKPKRKRKSYETEDGIEKRFSYSDILMPVVVILTIILLFLIIIVIVRKLL